jgi:hypothetical protein
MMEYDRVPENTKKSTMKRYKLTRNKDKGVIRNKDINSIN